MEFRKYTRATCPHNELIFIHEGSKFAIFLMRIISSAMVLSWPLQSIEDQKILKVSSL